MPSDIAPEEPAERKARHLAYLREAADLNMGLLRRAAEHAHEAYDLREAHASPNPPEPSPAPQPDPHQAFSRYARILRSLLAEEARIAGNAHDRRSGAGLPRTSRYRMPAPTDPRTPILRAALQRASHGSPDRAALRRALDERLEQDLADNPTPNEPVFDIYAAICKDFGFPVDLAKLPDELLCYSRAPSPARNSSTTVEPAPPLRPGANPIQPRR